MDVSASHLFREIPKSGAFVDRVDQHAKKIREEKAAQAQQQQQQQQHSQSTPIPEPPCVTSRELLEQHWHERMQKRLQMDEGDRARLETWDLEWFDLEDMDGKNKEMEEEARLFHLYETEENSDEDAAENVAREKERKELARTYGGRELTKRMKALDDEDADLVIPGAAGRNSMDENKSSSEGMSLAPRSVQPRSGRRRIRRTRPVVPRDANQTSSLVNTVSNAQTLNKAKKAGSRAKSTGSSSSRQSTARSKVASSAASSKDA